MDSELIDRLRSDLTAADFRTETVSAHLGPVADGARLRGVWAPARRVLDERESGPLSTLCSLFLLGASVPYENVDAAFPLLQADGALTLGLLVNSDAGLRAALSLNPISIEGANAADGDDAVACDWWIISDLDDQLRRGPARPDHVMGTGGATRSLIAQMPTHPVDRALDLGTGCGVVALHLALRSHVVATDISERALTFARANARLNGLQDRIELRQGSLFEPVAGEVFDLIVSNPPFVITPRTDDVPVYEYRDGGMTGDELAASVVQSGPAHLREGGTLLCLANWECPWGTDGLERVRTWITGSSARPVGAWVIERDRVAPALYAETWARDGGARPGDIAFENLLDDWLDDFAARKVAAIGLGAIRIKIMPSSTSTIVHTEQAAGAFADTNVGRDLDRAFDTGIMVSAMPDTAVLDARWMGNPSVREERIHAPGTDTPSAITLCTESPIARRVTADTLLAAAFGACDGDLTLRQIADALATLLEVDADAAGEALVSSMRELVWLGMASPVTQEAPPLGSLE